MNTTLEPPETADPNHEQEAASNRFRKKPVVIEAFQMTPERRADNRDWPEWLNEAWNKAADEEGAVTCVDFPNSDGTDKLQIVTLEGTMLIEWGDWIIRGVKGELYPCKPDIFAATYETERAEQEAAEVGLTVIEGPEGEIGSPLVETAKEPVATLWLPEVKSSKAVTIWGGSGKKYIFQKSDATQGRPARVYFDTTTLERAEKDLRANHRNLISVCTLLGKSDLAVRAGEGVQALIAATKIPAGMRKEALKRVAVIAAEGLAGLGHIADPVANVAPPAPVTPSVPVPAGLPPAPQPIVAQQAQVDPATAPDAPQKTWQPKENYTEAQLAEMALDDLRALAAHYKVEGEFRRQIVRAWFKNRNQ